VRGTVAVLLFLLAVSTPAQEPAEPQLEGPVGHAPAASFEQLWSQYRLADDQGDSEVASRALEEIRKLRILVARGLARLQKGEVEQAEADFRHAIVFDPQLPDAHFGMARIGGFPSNLRSTVAGVTAQLGASLGRRELLNVLLGVWLLTVFATTTIVAATLLVRHGALLRHDLEEGYGPGLALGLYVFLLLLPIVALQGYGWLPLWWMALLFVYATRTEKAVVLVVLAVVVASGPLIEASRPGLLAQQNPLLRASLLAIDGGPDQRGLADIEAAAAANGEDRDLRYLLGLSEKKAGLYAEAEAVYRDTVESDPNDSIALNNLANLEFLRGDFDAAVAHYTAGAATASSDEFKATFYYNLSLAHLQRFEYDPAAEARSRADQLAGSLTEQYDTLWKYDEAGSAVAAVVDLGPSSDQAWAKLRGAREGVGEQNVLRGGASGSGLGPLGRGLMGRLTVFLAVFGLVVQILSRWRGSRMFTLHCLKCGAPFCQRCQLRASTLELCTQCHHIFIVRDGVSAPARNQKMQEVRQEEARKRRVFRILSLVVPGAGHLYAQNLSVGLPLVVIWSAVLAAAALAAPLAPLTTVSTAAAAPWSLALGGGLLLAVYVVAHLLTPSFEAAITLPRRGARRAGGSVRTG